MTMFPEDLVLRWDNAKNTFVVHWEFAVVWGKYIFVVPHDFATDLASIPRWATGLVPKLGHHLQAAVAHDYAYENDIEGMTKAEADRMFYEGMLESGVRRTRAWLMYAAVKLGGKGRWK